MKQLLLIGGGGHAKVVVDAALRSGLWDIVGILDDDPALIKSAVLGVPVLGAVNALHDFDAAVVSVVVAVGSNATRSRIQARVKSSGFAVATVIHPAATIAPSASVEGGSVLMAGAIVNADSKLGEGVIINTGATVDHDCVIADFAHVAPGASLCGGVRVGARSLIGVGAVAIPGVSIANDCMVGAGAVLTQSVAEGSRVVGAPARRI